MDSHQQPLSSKCCIASPQMVLSEFCCYWFYYSVCIMLFHYILICMTLGGWLSFNVLISHQCLLFGEISANPLAFFFFFFLLGYLSITVEFLKLGVYSGYKSFLDIWFESIFPNMCLAFFFFYKYISQGGRETLLKINIFL